MLEITWRTTSGALGFTRIRNPTKQYLSCQIANVTEPPATIYEIPTPRV